MLKAYAVNDTNDTLLHRKHANVQCSCHHCKRFDHANTTTLDQPEQLPHPAVIELIQAIDSETWERYNYILVPRKPRPYNKYQRD